MKRPHGFDQPAAPTPAATPPAARRGKKPPAEPATLAAAPSEAPEPLAKVVPLHVETRPQAPSADRVQGSGEPVAREAGREAGRDARAARRHARAATRDRRRYERDEVRRFTLRSRRRRTILSICLGAVALLIAFVLIGAFSPLMALRHIEVRGADRISENDIVQALDDQMGRPLTLIDNAEVRQVLGTFPLIRSYSTEARPPDTLVIRLVERTPLAVLKTSQSFQLVDQAKVVIEETAKRPDGYPLITTATGDAGDTGFTAAVAVLVSLPGQLRATVDTVNGGTRDDVTLTLTGGTRVVWGSAEDSELKAVVLAQLMKKTAPESVTEYDVSSPGSAVVR